MKKSPRSCCYGWLTLIVWSINVAQPWPVCGITDGANADETLGELDETDLPFFTKAGVNNSPHNRGMNTPYDVSIDTVSHRLFAVDSVNNRILVYDLDGSNNLIDRIADRVLGQLSMNVNPAATSQSGLDDPRAVAVDPASSRLFVADFGNNRILIFDVASVSNGENAVNVLGQANFTGGGAATSQTRLSGPLGVAFDPATQRLFVGDSANNRIIVYDVTSITNGENAVAVLGRPNFTSNGAGTAQNRLRTPMGVVYSSSTTDLYVADSANNRVMIFDVAAITNGENAVSELGQNNFTTATAATAVNRFNSPRGVALNLGQTDLYVADFNNNRIMVFDVAAVANGENAVNVLGQANFTTATAGTTQSGLRGPHGLAFDSTTNRLYAADRDNHRILFHDVSSISDGQAAADGLGQLNASDASHFTKGAIDNAPNNRGYNGAFSVDIDTVSHRLFSADYNNNRVLVYNLDATNNLPDRVADYVLGQPDFDSNAAATTQTGMNSPRGVTFDLGTNRLYVGDTLNNRVMVFDVSGISNGQNALAVLGQPNFTSAGAATTQAGLSAPRRVAVDSALNRLFVPDTGNNRVIVYDVASITNGENAVNVLGQANFTSGGAATTQNRFNNVSALGYDPDNNRLFAADTLNNRVLVFDVASITNGENADNVLGQANFTGAGAATAQNRMDLPVGATYGPALTRLFVADGNNNRILVFDVSSIANGQNAANVLGQSLFTTAAAAVTQNGMDSPRGINYDVNLRKLYVPELGNNRVTIFNLEIILGISVSPNGYQFGTVNLGATTVSTASLLITNTGNIAETYALSVSTTGSQTVWSVKPATPTVFNQFVLFGAMNAAPPGAALFGTEDAATTALQSATATRYSLGGETGVSVPAGQIRHLWMRLDMPLSTSTTIQQQMAVSVVATPP